MTRFTRLMKFFENFPFGVLVGFIFGMLFAIYLGSDISASAKSNVVGVATVFGTLFAAGFATFGVITTVRQQEVHRQKERTDRLKAARAALPMALTKLIAISKNGIQYSLADKEFLKAPENAQKVSDALEIPTEVIEILRSCIENADDETGKWLSLTISHYQVYRSRILGLISDRNMAPRDIYRADNTASWCIYHAIVEHLFRFAREGTRPAICFEKDRLFTPMFDRAGHPLEGDIRFKLNNRFETEQSRSVTGLAFKGD